MWRLLVKGMLLAAAVTLSGCTSGYWGDRARDFGDVFTVTAGYGLGARAQAGPLVGGLSFYSDVAGVRCGDVGYFLDRKIYRDVAPGDIAMILYSSNFFETAETNDRRKTIRAGTFIIPVIPWILNVPLPFLEFQDKTNKKRSAAFYTQIEVTAAVGGGVRLGFNPGELLDLFLGFFGMDIYSDDLYARRKRILSDL